MVQGLLIIIIFVLWLVNFVLEERNLLAPSCVYCMVILGSLLMCYISKKDYEFELEIATFVLLVGSTLIFTSVSLIHYFNRKKYGISFPTRISNDFSQIVISKYVMIAFIVVELIVGYYAIKYIKDVAVASTGGYSGLSIAIGIYDNLQKFDLTSLVKLNVRKHAIYSLGWPLLTSISYILIYVVCHNFILCKKKNYLLFFVIGVYFALTFLSGGRTYAFRVMTAFVAFIFYFRCMKYGFHKRQLSFLIKIFIVAIGVVIFFTFMRQALGRSVSDYKWYQTMFSYFGAPIVNLDYYLKTEIFPSSALFGQESFYGIYNYVGNRFGISSYIYSLDLPFVFCTGRNTGNVYTMFYQFIHDFGYIGVIPLVSIIVLIYNKLYRNILRDIKHAKNISISLFYFGYLFNDLVMLMFSNKFYETTIAINFVRFVIWTTLIWNIVIQKKYRLVGTKIIRRRI